METKNEIKYNINGVFGEVDYADIDLSDLYYSARHNGIIRDIRTGEDVSYINETSGLPDGVDMDIYFKMALLKRLENIETAIKSLVLHK